MIKKLTLAIAIFAISLSAQMRPIDPLGRSGLDTMDDFQSVCFGAVKAAPQPETYWAGVCRFQRFDDGDWRVITSASPLGPIERTWGPQEIDVLLEYEDLKLFPLSLFAILYDWGNIFLAPRDLDVQLDISRKVNEFKDPDAVYGVVAVKQRAIVTVSNFMGENFNGGIVNLVEIYIDVQEDQASELSPARAVPTRARAAQQQGSRLLQMLAGSATE